MRRRRPRAATPAGGSARACWSSTTKRAIRDLLAKTLALAEHDVDLAPDGRTALERLRMHPYDLLITDLKMPGDGRADRHPRGAPATRPICRSSSSPDSRPRRARSKRSISASPGYLTKPFRVPQVLAAAAKALGE
mgnify:CR=1 FL=1